MSVKVMIAFGNQTYGLLDTEARERGISVQELLRAVIIPEWFRTQGTIVPKNHGYKNNQNYPISSSRTG